MIEFLSDFKDDTIDAIENIKDEPIQSLAYIIPVFVSMVAIIGFLVAYIIFMVNGGYSRQVDLFQEKNFEAILQTFSWGTISVVLKGFLPIFEGIFLIIQLVFLVITFYLEESGFRKVLITINFVIMGLVLAFFLFALWGDANSISKDMDKNTVEIIRKLVIPMFLVGVISVITFFIQLFFSECKEQVVYTLFAIGMSYLVIPLLLLVLENIIPLIIVVIVAVIVGIIFLVLAIGSGSGASGSSGGGYSSSSGTDWAQIKKETREEAEKAENEKKQKKKEERIKYLIHQIDEYEKGLKKHYNNEFGYELVDPKVTRDAINKMKDELKRLGAYH